MSLALTACTAHQQSLHGISLFLDLSSRLYVGGYRKALEVCESGLWGRGSGDYRREDVVEDD
jgi:hypothetical protein